MLAQRGSGPHQGVDIGYPDGIATTHASSAPGALLRLEPEVAVNPTLEYVTDSLSRHAAIWKKSRLYSEIPPLCRYLVCLGMSSERGCPCPA